MIEEAGLKGYTVGGAQVSEKHAGFIINKGGATADDVLKLIEHIKSVIKEREGIDIETEIRVID
jgi:UDP-N-acetylmuramate dehydrogenase